MASPLSGSPAPVKPTEPPAQPAAPKAAPEPRAEPVAVPEPLPVRGDIERPLQEILYAEPYAFDFFQAVRLLEKIDPKRRAVGRGGSPSAEVARFRAHLSLHFPPSAIYDLTRPTPDRPIPNLTVAFLGLTGPSGALPRHYTELMLRIDKEAKGAEKNSLRDWLDLFNHRLISLFYRAWEKYRFYIPYERGEHARPDPDPFTLGLFSLVGLGVPQLRNRLRVSSWVEDEERGGREQALARVDDLALLYYGGFLAHRPRNAVSLEALLRDYFDLPVRVMQFQGQWLLLEPDNQSQLGAGDSNNQLGVSVVAGERVWDVQSKFRVRLGPLRFPQFTEFLPDRALAPQRKAFFLLSHLVRLYVGPELDFEVQLVLKAGDVPECRLVDQGGIGPRLGWNTWVRSQAYPHDAGEAVFPGEEPVLLNRDGLPSRDLVAVEEE